MRRLVMWQVPVSKLEKKSVLSTEDSSASDLIAAIHVAVPPTASLQARDLTSDCCPFLLLRQRDLKPDRSDGRSVRSDAHTRFAGGSHAAGGPGPGRADDGGGRRPSGVSGSGTRPAAPGRDADRLHGGGKHTFSLPHVALSCSESLSQQISMDRQMC